MSVGSRAHGVVVHVRVTRRTKQQVDFPVMSDLRLNRACTPTLLATRGAASPPLREDASPSLHPLPSAETHTVQSLWIPLRCTGAGRFRMRGSVQCAVAYRLQDPHLDSRATPDEKQLKGLTTSQEGH